MSENLCSICPRECRVNRNIKGGICGTRNSLKIARVGLHQWEEPCISHKNGSGTIFFSGCNLKCIFCQNVEISKELKGVEISTDDLSDEILKLQDSGAENINFVTPTHFTIQIIRSLDKIKHKLRIPVCYNCGGYEKEETLSMLDGYVDIFMPDFKYFDSALSERYSGAADYFNVASRALNKMYDLVGYARYDNEGKMTKGVLTRHLVLPSHTQDSIKILEYISQNYDVVKFALSIMNQYFPTSECEKYSEINRKLTSLEYQKVVKIVEKLGFKNCYIQHKSSATKAYVPNFDYEGK